MYAGPKEVFLSHSNFDREFADKLAAVLRRHGIPVWYSRTDIVAVSRWHDEIGDALLRCDWFALLLSPESVESAWVKRELMFALESSTLSTRIIPIVVKKCDIQRLSWTLSALQFVDFTHDFDTGCRSLLRIWGLGYRSAP
jgi:hypothetical protein